ncbi:MAG: hypothetical protein IK016_04555 [Lachnospiraceae bacterium]|nr:hypothetical protein [Lachnospiraceae bacterium]
MALPIVFIGIAAVTGVTGVGTTVKAGVDQSRARTINDASNKRIEWTGNRLNALRKQCGETLQALGEEKLFVLNRSIRRFLASFEKIKNVDFRDAEGLRELHKFHIDKTDFEELEKTSSFSLSLLQGGMAGVAGGALTAFGAYSAATTFAAASTGTAISALSGAAATNATLAFFGGGSLAAGGLGMAGGMAVLGGLVAGPALLVLGVITGANAGKALEEAYANEAKANQICEELEAGADQCIAIRRRTNLFYCLLARLDAMMYPLLNDLEDVIASEGEDYRDYSADAKKTVMRAASLAVSIKSVLDTPILSEDGSLTEDFAALVDDLME